MPKQKRGRPITTGKGTLVGVRLLPNLLAKIDEWRQSQAVPPSRPAAVRHLAELGLQTTAGPHAHPAAVVRVSNRNISKASELAGKTIDRLRDESASGEEQERRKRRLLKGPSEFRHIRARANPKKTRR